MVTFFSQPFLLKLRVILTFASREAFSRFSEGFWHSAMDRPFQKDPKASSIRKLKEADDDPRANDSLFASTISLIWKVVTERRYAIPEADLPDVAQEAVLRVWKWREKYHKRAGGMTIEEWHSFTAKTAHNEINRFSTSRAKIREVPIDDAFGTAAPAAKGETDAEMVSLIGNVWQEICRLTLYQRRALLLGSELIVDLVQFSIAKTEIAGSLEITTEEWADILTRVPLSDREIAARSSKTNSISKTAGAIGKARYDARRKLERLNK